MNRLIPRTGYKPYLWEIVLSPGTSGYASMTVEVTQYKRYACLDFYIQGQAETMKKALGFYGLRYLNVVKGWVCPAVP